VKTSQRQNAEAEPIEHPNLFVFKKNHSTHILGSNDFGAKSETIVSKMKNLQSVELVNLLKVS
jgi:hypothetical protein